MKDNQSSYPKVKNAIFDLDKKRWYVLKRGPFGRLILQEQVYTKVRKFATGGEIGYSACNGVKIIDIGPPPMTPQSRLSPTRTRDKT